MLNFFITFTFFLGLGAFMGELVSFGNIWAFPITILIFEISIHIGTHFINLNKWCFNQLILKFHCVCMILYLVGISCVGKTTIGKMLADKIGFLFFDLDDEIEAYYSKPIERIQDQCFNMDAYRVKASVVLNDLLSRNIDAVIAGTPSGLKMPYLQVYKRHKENKDLYSIHIKDSFRNVLNRLTFYDKDSNPVTKKLDDSTKTKYFKEIKADYNYFKSSYDRADFKIDISHISLNDVPNKIINEIKNSNTLLLSQSKGKKQ